jgi:hypothetical protein
VATPEAGAINAGERHPNRMMPVVGDRASIASWLAKPCEGEWNLLPSVASVGACGRRVGVEGD